MIDTIMTFVHIPFSLIQSCMYVNWKRRQFVSLVLRMVFT